MGVGGLGLATTMSLNVMERRGEMGMIRAIGARSSTVWLIIVTEGIVVGVLSWALAALAAWPVSKFVGDALVRLMFNSALDFSFNFRACSSGLPCQFACLRLPVFCLRGRHQKSPCGRHLRMSKKSSLVTLVVVILISAALVFGGGRWLWHLLLKMHGMQ